MKPRALDLYCGAGGASMGLHRAGFEVVGVDINAQKRYPFEFYQADAATFPLEGFHLVWASPVCKKFSVMTKRWSGRADGHPDQIADMRERLMELTGAKAALGVIENVLGAPLIEPTVLCGSMFGLKVRRHRGFECNFNLGLLPSCDHSYPVVGVYGHAGGSSKRDGISFGGVDTWRSAMGIDWMTGDELAQAIPPAYAEFIGRAALAAMGATS